MKRSKKYQHIRIGTTYNTASRLLITLGAKCPLCPGGSAAYDILAVGHMHAILYHVMYYISLISLVQKLSIYIQWVFTGPSNHGRGRISSDPSRNQTAQSDSVSVLGIVI